MKKNIIIVGLLVVAVVAVVGIKKKKLGTPGATSCVGGVCTLPIPAGRPLSEDPKIGKTAPKALPLLLELGSTSCVACKAMAPIIDGLKETYA